MQNEKSASVGPRMLAPWTFSWKSGLVGPWRSAQRMARPILIFKKMFRERAFLAQLRGRLVPDNATRFLVLFRDLSVRGFWMEFSLLNTFKTITTLDMKKDFVDNIDLSVQERKSWCFVGCWNTSDLESVLSRLHPDIFSIQDSWKIARKWSSYPGNEKKASLFQNSATKKLWITFLVSWKFPIACFSCPNILDCIELTIPSFSDPYRPNRYPRGDPATKWAK